MVIKIFSVVTVCVSLIFIPGKAISQDYVSIKKELTDIYELDQKYRIVLDSLVRKAGLQWDHPDIQKIIPVAAKQDSFNLSRVLSILDSCGWIGVKQIGAKANQTLFAVIQHADSSILIKYFPLLAKSYELNETPGKYYALMLDRILVDRGQKQLYGTQMQMEKKDGKFIPYPIEDEAGVNQRRKKVGLEPLEEYLKKMNQ
jgi:hypothetical protein